MKPNNILLSLSIFIASAVLSWGLWQSSERNRYVLSPPNTGSAVLGYVTDTKSGKVWLIYGTGTGSRLVFDPALPNAGSQPTQ